MSSAEEEDQTSSATDSDGGSKANRGGLGRLERQAERERARAQAQRVMDMCASRSAMQIFEAVGGDVEGSVSSRNLTPKDGDVSNDSGGGGTGGSSDNAAGDSFARSFLWRDHDDGEEVVHPSSMNAGASEQPSSGGVFGTGLVLFGASRRSQKRASANNASVSLAALRTADHDSGGEAERGRPSLFSVADLRDRLRDSIFSGDGRNKKKDDVEFHRNIAPRRHSRTALDFGHFDPSLYEDDDEGEKGACSTWRDSLVSKCREHKKIILVVAAAAAIITVGVVGLTVGDGGDATSFLGITFGREKDRFETMKAAIVKSGISSANSFDDPNSPQTRALKWIATDDPSAISVKDAYMPQRYALACLWFASTPGEELRVDRVDNEENAASSRILQEELDPQWVKTENWLSGTGLCSWEGITCLPNPNGAVSETQYDGNNGITAITLASNGMKGAIPREVFTALPDLLSLDLKDNDIAALPDEMGSAEKLEFLRLENNAIAHLPDSVGDMKALRLLNLYHNVINGTIPRSISALSNCRELYFDSNFFIGSIDGIFNNMPNLIDLRLRRNMLSGTIPSFFHGVDNLEILYLDANEFRGTLSQSFGDGLPKLRELTLYKNQLTGELPSSLSKMSKLEHLYIDHNGFVGSFPQGWSKLKKLRHLFVYSNALTGSLDVVTEMISMEKLRLEENQFSETISGAIGGLKNLEVLVLSNNNISGELPTELGQLSKLNRLMAPNTKIDGIVPDEVCTLTKDFALTEFVMTCKGRGMERGVLCSCCTECKSDLDV